MATTLARRPGTPAALGFPRPPLTATMALRATALRILRAPSFSFPAPSPLLLQQGPCMSLYDPRFDHDACGIGFVADASGTPSRRIVEAALEGLAGVKHRGAVAADGRSGDGAGLLLPLPAAFLAAEVAQGLDLVGWREVPVRPEALGDSARSSMPSIAQALFTRPAELDSEAAERRCYLARKHAEAAAASADAHAYFASWSFRTITYKALSAADQLGEFYPDLSEPRVVGWFAIFHQRYSTNTAPAWERAQPFRFLCHNGEINTIEGNVNLMRAREGRLGASWEELGQEGDKLLTPVIDGATPTPHAWTTPSSCSS